MMEVMNNNAAYTEEMILRFAKNVQDICRYNEIRIGKFEESIGVSAGYFSRIISAKYTSRISLEKAITISNALGFSVTDLLTVDYSYLLREAEIRETKRKIDVLQKMLEELEADD